MILEQLPAYIERYPSNDQLFLNNIVKVLQRFEDADKHRKQLSQQLFAACAQISSDKEYLKQPFSWFAYSFLDNSRVLLEVATFHADEFIDYILTYLRQTFQLVRAKIPLMDSKWEKLQYDCMKIRVPLDIDELQVLLTIYQQLQAEPLSMLRPHQLSKVILSLHPHSQSAGEIKRLVNVLDVHFDIWPHYPAFGLESVVCHLWLPPHISLSNILDYSNVNNYILTTSSIHSIRGKPNEFLCLLWLPSGLHSRLKKYFLSCKEKGLLLDFTLFMMEQRAEASSLAQYSSGVGWREISNSRWKQIAKRLLYKRSSDLSQLSYLTSSGNPDWDFRVLPNPIDAIKLICKPIRYTYADLSSNIYDYKEWVLLTSLFDQEVFFSNIIIQRLFYEYSLDIYWVVAPQLSISILSPLLELIPHTTILFTDVHSHLLCWLTPQMSTRLHELGWQVFPVILDYPRLFRDFRMFNSETLTWRTPEILT